MKQGQVLHLDAATHKVVDVLLPWFVNGTLAGDERALVHEHLAQCERCRREVEWLQELSAACAAAAEAPGGSPALRHLRQRLMASRGILGGIRSRWQRGAPWPRALIAAQLAAILVLGAVVAGSDETRAPYRTLAAAGSAAPATASLVAVFDPATSELELRRMLRAAGARIVDGPNQANAYLLDAPEPAQALRALKAERQVVLVEPLR